MSKNDTKRTVTIQKCPICGRNTQRLTSHIRLAHPENNEAPAAPEPPKDTSYNPAVVIRNQEAFTKDELLQAARQTAKAEPIDEDDSTDIVYQCDTCGAKLKQNYKECPGCHRALMWGDI